MCIYYIYDKLSCSVNHIVQMMNSDNSSFLFFSWCQRSNPPVQTFKPFRSSELIILLIYINFHLCHFEEKKNMIKKLSDQKKLYLFQK